MKSAVIFENQHYCACIVGGGYLTVQRKLKKREWTGVYLKPETAAQWIDAIKDADDAKEAAAYCRALLSP